MENRSRPDANSNISNLLWMLRSENATQYFTLVKMHLSFTTDMPTDQCDGKLDNTKGNSSKWNLTPLRRRFKSNSNSNTPKCVMDGVPLTEEGVCHAYQLINFLSKDENIKQEGIFRKTGSFIRQQDLKTCLNAGNSLNLERGPFSAHDCASVLKNFLAELPEPLLQEDHYHVHCRIAEMCSSEINQDSESQSHKRRVKSLQLVFLLLPLANYHLLKDLLLLLHKAAQFEHHNKMSASNLGTMFAPQILCPRKMTPNDMRTFSKVLSTAIAFMIENADKLFQIPFELEVDVRHYWNCRNKSTTDETDGLLTDAATSTTLSFIDKDLTAKANDDDVTKIALANLYAYVQSLPESARKKRLVKQFNDASGKGTPVKGRGDQKEPKLRMTISDSIKVGFQRHLLNKAIKNKKAKPQELSSIYCKRSNSDDYLNNSSCCSPELKLFRRMSPKRAFKSMEDLSPSQSSSPPYHVANGQSIKGHVTPSRKGLADTSREFISTPELGFYGTVSLSDQSTNMSTYSSTPQTPCNKTDRVSPQVNPCVFSPGEDSPISRAVLTSNIQQRDIMTPRSRCPIMIDSCTSLASVYMNDLRKDKNKSDKLHMSEVRKENCPTDSSTPLNHSKNVKFDSRPLSSTNSVASDLSTYNSASSSISNYNSVSSNSPTDDKGILNSGSSLFGGFFDKLSTSSLMKLTSRLSVSSLRPPGGLSPCIESAIVEEPESDQANNSLSSVFKEYLMDRSSLSNEATQQCRSPETNLNTISPNSRFNPCLSSPNEASLSDSLLYCLDGNNPVGDSDGSCSEISLSGETSARADMSPKDEHHYQCSSSGRKKLFRNNNGTPLPKRDHDENVIQCDPKCVKFETSF